MAHPVRTALRVFIVGLGAVVIVALITGNYAALTAGVGEWLTATVWPPGSAVSHAFANWFVGIFFPKP